MWTEINLPFFKQLPPGHLQPPKNHFNFFKFKYQENKFEVVMDVLVEDEVGDGHGCGAG